MNDSTSQSGSDEYAALIKPGDAVQTPDGELWVVLTGDEPLLLASAYRNADDEICADRYDVTRTRVTAALVTKVADARQVRRP